MGGGALNLDFMDDLDDGRDLLDVEFEQKNPEAIGDED